MIETSAVPPGAQVSLIIGDAVGGSTATGPPVWGPGILTIPLSGLSSNGVDVTQIDFVRLIFSGSGAGSWEIRDIRSVGPPPPVPLLTGPAAFMAAAMLVATALLMQRRRNVDAR